MTDPKFTEEELAGIRQLEEAYYSSNVDNWHFRNLVQASGCGPVGSGQHGEGCRCSTPEKRADQQLPQDVRAAFARRLGREVKPPPQESTAQAKEREAKQIAQSLERSPNWPPGAKAEVTWAGDHWRCIMRNGEVTHVTTSVSIQLRCQCGSGNHTRGPGHSDYCPLFERP